MLLVPEELYRGMIAASDSLSDTARVAIAKAEADKVLRSRKKKSTRRVLYDKKLRDYLKLRKEAAEKPVKVEISGGPQAPFSSTPVTSSTQTEEVIKKNKKQRKPRQRVVSPVEETPENTQTTTPPRQPSPAQAASDIVPETPRTSRHERLVEEQARRKLAIQERVSQIVDYVRANHEKFGVTGDDRIIGPRNNVVANSNLEMAIRSLITPYVAAGRRASDNTPPGTMNIRSRLAKDETANNMIKQAAELISAQSGRGRKRRTCNFKPTLWKRS